MRRRAGGLDDLEALVQLVRARAAAADGPAARVLSSAVGPDVTRLLAAQRLLRQVENLVGTALRPGADVDAAPRGFRLALLRATDVASLADLRAAVEAASGTIASALALSLASD
jgi:hypothetical protein